MERERQIGNGRERKASVQFSYRRIMHLRLEGVQPARLLGVAGGQLLLCKLDKTCRTLWGRCVLFHAMILCLVKLLSAHL